MKSKTPSSRMPHHRRPSRWTARLVAPLAAMSALVAAACVAPVPAPTSALRATLDISGRSYISSQSAVIPFTFDATSSGSGTAAIVAPTVTDTRDGQVLGFDRPQTSQPDSTGYTYVDKGTCSSASISALTPSSGSGQFTPARRIEVDYSCAAGQQFQVFFTTTTYYWDAARTGLDEEWVFTTEVDSGAGFTNFGPAGSITTKPTFVPQPTLLVSPPPLPLPITSLVRDPAAPTQIDVTAYGSINQSIALVGNVQMKLANGVAVGGGTTGLVLATDAAKSIRQDIKVQGCDAVVACTNPNAIGTVTLANNVPGAFVNQNGETIASPSIVFDLVGGSLLPLFTFDSDLRAACQSVNGELYTGTSRDGSFIPPGATTLPQWNCRVFPAPTTTTQVQLIQSKLFKGAYCTSLRYQAYRTNLSAHFNCASAGQSAIPWS